MFVVSSFFAVSVCTFLGSWFLFAVSSGFFAVLLGFFAVSKSANTWKNYQNDKKCKNCLAAEKSAASNSSWKGNKFAYVGRRRYWAGLFEWAISRCHHLAPRADPLRIFLHAGVVHLVSNLRLGETKRLKLAGLMGWRWWSIKGFGSPKMVFQVP